MPVGVFTYSDYVAGYFCSTCISTGVSVPEDVAVIGYGNILHSCLTAPVPLSSVDPNNAAIGREAARLLHNIMSGDEPEVASIPIPPVEVVERHSTDVMAVQNPTVARALRFIWDHYTEVISPEEVARASAVSRRGLDKLFEKYLGRTVNAEINRKRLERCAELLRGSDLSAADIAAINGFRTDTYFYKLFRKTYGMSTREYRSQR